MINGLRLSEGTMVSNEKESHYLKLHKIVNQPFKNYIGFGTNMRQIIQSKRSFHVSIFINIGAMEKI